ncbi:MAG: hypothetical protein H0X30_32915 [Anaerolineae bacterium]|nr:hypothetical protein [Anaerolineae bacterium]
MTSSSIASTYSLAERSLPYSRTRRVSSFWWVIVLMLVVAWLGISGLDKDAMWYDEIYSYIYAGGQQYGPIP